MREVVLLVNNDPDGLPKKQVDLETWVAERCIELFGSEPSIAMIRKKVAPLYQALRQKGP